MPSLLALDKTDGNIVPYIVPCTYFDPQVGGRKELHCASRDNHHATNISDLLELEMRGGQRSSSHLHLRSGCREKGSIDYLELHTSQLEARQLRTRFAERRQKKWAVDMRLNRPLGRSSFKVWETLSASKASHLYSERLHLNSR